ncbi:MAG: FISUMP domain-containing protein [Bacteroidales bacterium]
MKPFFLSLLVFATFNVSAQEFKCGDFFTDPRDETRYQTVQIGDQCWIAQNMNIGVIVEDHDQTDNGIIEKTCWGNDPENCEIFGGLYTWEEALQYSVGENNQGICPEGWHIPTMEEWKALSDFLGEDSAGYKMKVSSKHFPAWDGDNSSGFTALPGGAGYAQYFHRINSWALFWSSTPNGEDRAWFTQLDNFWYPSPPKYNNLYIGDYYQKFNGLSVRCIRNAN